MILQHPRRLRAERLGDVFEVVDDLLVAAQAAGGRDHHARGAEVHHACGEFLHRGKPRRRDADHHGHAAAHAIEHALDEAARLVGRELGRFAHDAEQRETRGAALEVEVDHAVGAFEVERTAFGEGGHRDQIDAACGFVESGHVLPVG